MSLFRLDASIRVDGSQSRALADTVEAEWRTAHPDDDVVRRDLGRDPVPSHSWGTAVGAGFVDELDRSPEQRDAVALAKRDVDAMVGADALLFAVPLYNFGVSQHFKTWVDLMITDPRLAAGVEPVLAGKPAVLVTVRGGNYAPGTPRSGWDHSTDWLRRILADVWRLDLSVVERDFTLVGVNPALDQFRDLAADLHAEAEETARRHGRELAGALTR